MDKFPNQQTEANEAKKEILPFKRVDGIEHSLTWDDFDQDETGECVFVYRALQNMNLDLAGETAHKSQSASFGESKEQIFQRFKTESIQDIARYSTEFTQGNSPTLHTTRNKYFAQSFVGEQGVFIAYKIPKKWMLEKKEEIFIGNDSEFEMDFFHEIPKEFVFKVEQKGDLDVKTNIGSVSSKEDDVINLNNLPPAPIDASTNIF